MNVTPPKRRKRPKPMLRFTSTVEWVDPGPDAPMKVGYVRVSTDDQTTQRQVDELVRAGVHPDDIWGDKASGSSMDRDGWYGCARDLRAGDTLVIHSLDRLSRDLVHTMTTLQELNARGVAVKVLTLDFDSQTPMGKFVFSIMAAFAQFERDTIMERTMHGLAMARARGVTGGSKPTWTDEQIRAAVDQHGTYKAAAKALKCAEITVKRRMAAMRKEAKGDG